MTKSKIRTAIDIIRALVRQTGFDVVKYPTVEPVPPDLADWEREILTNCRPFTLTTYDRLAASVAAVKHVEEHGVQGAIVECGVWRGGNMMAMAQALTHCGNTSRHLFLYDTFAGMSEPTEFDIDYRGEVALKAMKSTPKGQGIWCEAGIDDVRANMSSTGYPKHLISYVEGKVEESLPKVRPDGIAVLRLDTDWYESTKAELEYLFPLLKPGGVLILDDYGHWKGSRKACDEYFKSHQIKMFLHRVDFGCRFGIK